MTAPRVHAQMRIALAGISHETNTYCTAQTPAAEFQQLRGERLLLTRGQESDIGGAVSACEALGVEPVPILYASAQPSGVIEREAYEGFKREIEDGLRRAGALDGGLDGVVLCLHGAGVVDGIEDLEGDLAAAVRALVGPDLPIAASFDLHGNVSQAMADALDAVFACRHYPHVDMHVRAADAVGFVVRQRQAPFATAIHVERIPMLVPTTTTLHGPGQHWLERTLAAEQTPGVLDVSWFHGFPYTDVADAGSALVVTTAGDSELAESVARELARALWSDRESFRPVSLSATAAIAAARAATAHPVVINETSDNCGGGAPGDGTHLLRAMLEAGLEQACFGFIVDREAAARAHAAGVGSTLELALGGRYDELHGDPLPVRAYVKALHDGRLTLQAMFRGAPQNLGPLVRLVVGGLDIIVASRRSQTFDAEPFLALGIDVRRYRYVALKSSNHFRAGFRDIAGTIVTADTPGLCTHRLEIFPRLRAREPLWPVDPAARYD